MTSGFPRFTSTVTTSVAIMASCVSLTSMWAEDHAKAPFKGKLLVEGLVGSQIAAKPLVDHPNSFAIDEQGRFYVVESPRLKTGGIIDIRGARQFTLKDFSLTTVEERRQMLLADKTKDNYTRSSDRVVLLEDTNGDGIPDQRHPYVVDGLGNAEDGLAFSALAYDNQVFLTCIPNLWRFVDRDGDHKAEVREKLLTGFGVAVSMMGHDMHGIIRGPDGRLYWSIGDRGFNVMTKEGVRLQAPNRGAIFRSEPDGSKMEVFFNGLRNPQEIAFDEFGNLMTFDNTGDIGDIARVVYAMEGGDAGWEKEHQVPHQYRWAFPDKEVMTSTSRWVEENMFRPNMDDQPQWLLPAIGNFQSGPSGIVYAAGESLPDSLQGSFLVSNYRGESGNSNLLSFKLTPDGAGFKLRDKDPLIALSGIGLSDVDIGYDGRLYILDFGGGWTANDRGAIHAVEWPVGLQKPSVRATKEIFAAGFKKRTDLQQLLSHVDFRVRQRAQFELVERNDAATLLKTLGGTEGLYAKLHSLWGLGQLHRAGKGDHLARFIAAASSNEVELRVSALRILGDLKAPSAVPAFVTCLADASRRVQSHAAIALGKMKQTDAAPALWAALKKNDTVKDRYLRLAIVQALAAIGDQAGAVAQVGAAERELRLGATLVLRSLKDGQVVRFLQDGDKLVRTTALAAIYDNRITAAYPAVMKLTDQASDYFQTSQRRILVINYLAGGVEGAKGVMRLAGNPKVNTKVREQGLALLLRWNQLPEYDLINNNHLQPAERKETIYPGIHDELTAFLENEKSTLMAKGLDLANQVGMQMSSKLLIALAMNGATEMATRIASINALATKEADFKAALPGLMKLPEDPLKAALLDVHFTLKLDGRMAMAEEALTSKSPERIRVAITRLITADGAVARFEKLWRERERVLPAATHLDLFVAMQNAEQEPLKKAVEAFGADSNNIQALTLVGGDAVKGEAVFRGSGSCMQCHMVDNRGGLQGPALDSVGLRQDRATLLESIINPNAKITEGYGSITLTLKNGDSITGTLKSEKNGKVEVLLPTNEKQVVPLANIASREGPSSAMPPIGAVLPPNDLRDLIEYMSQCNAGEPAKKPATNEHGGK